jgi:peptide deformylase
LQHEMDHLNGVLYYDRINAQSPTSVGADWIKY